jgi:glutathione S-transferase
VGSARGRFGVAAPATTGEPNFERYFRVQQNTLEALMVFVPSLWIFAHRVSYDMAFVLGVVFILARAEYARSYIASAEGRAFGARLTLVVNAILLVGSILGLAVHAL